MTNNTLTLTAGMHFAPLGSRFPVPFMVVKLHPVKPLVTVRERFGDVEIIRDVKVSVLAHAARVHAAA